jgi:hypothetical protein
MDGGLVNFQLKEGRRKLRNNSSCILWHLSLPISCIARRTDPKSLQHILTSLLPIVTVLLTYLLLFMHAAGPQAEDDHGNMLLQLSVKLQSVALSLLGAFHNTKEEDLSIDKSGEM